MTEYIYRGNPKEKIIETKPIVVKRITYIK